MKRDYKIIAVDFDGTLCENKWPEIGAMNMKLIYHLIECRKKGDKVILWTCRNGEQLRWAVQACYWYGLKFDAVNENLPEVLEWMGGDSRKIYADEYIDDRANTQFRLPFVTCPFTPSVVSKLEALFEFKLHDWQVDYLQGRIDSVSNMGRGTGKTFIYCIKLLLGYHEPFDLQDYPTAFDLVDANVGVPSYRRWFRYYILDLDAQLKAAGFETNNKKKGA